MSEDRMQFTILADGTISIVTDSVSPANHMSADELLDMLADMAGGTRKATRRLDVSHAIQFSHEHDHHSHDHEHNHHH